MLQRIRNSKWSKVVACLLVILMFTEIIDPISLYAITGGPSQPEMAGFTPVDTDNLVDLFSGDFHYSIPIMTVPGPNGGFPITLNYTSGIGMEQEASWVGLGWNLNPGAINRQVRGIPDDFKGDIIRKTYKRRDNNTFLFSPSAGGEVFGSDFGIGASLSKSFIYNTYNGITLSQRFGISASYVRNGNVQSERTTMATANIGVDLNSDNGITTSFSMNGGSKNLKLGVNYGYNSKSGTYTYGNQISLNYSKQISAKSNRARPEGETRKDREEMTITGGGSVGTSFSTAAELPPIHIPLRSTGWGVSFQAGGSGEFLEGYGNVHCNIVNQKTPDEEVCNPAYGLMYAEEADTNSLQDFNREKDICVNRHSKNLPVPVMTNDIFNVTGESMAGSFRLYRSDYGHFYDNNVSVSTFTTDAGVDLGFGNGFQIGGDLSFSSGDSRSGDWKAEDCSSDISFKGKSEYLEQASKSIAPTLYEPFYFKMQGEQTASDLDYLCEIGGEKAVSFPITTQNVQSFWGGQSYNYQISNRLSSGTMNHFEQKSRAKRTNNIEFRTEEGGESPGRINEFSIVNANGERYTYGECLINHSEKEVQFSIGHVSGTDSSITNRYSSTDASNNNSKGKEKLYSCTNTPAYVYSYLLSQITSADYVDITGDGPSADDLGYWVKLTYERKYDKTHPYHWRFPYQGANFFMGDRSNLNDDMGSYNYGSKDLAYVKAIETKTHIAKFYISQRDDGLGVGSLEQNGGRALNEVLYKLDSIRLFSKEDTLIPIKTAVFEYDYSLCKGVPNQKNIGQGKLTLKKVYFKYSNSEKGIENPYVFQYSEAANFPYNATKMDRWGNYKDNANYFEHYVSQDKDLSDYYANAWLLTEIVLPSGGTINIEYESDDYAYVQDRQAMYMAKISPQTSFAKENGKYYIYFNKDANVTAKEYVSDFDKNLMFFKIALGYDTVKEPDYVQGYVEIKPETASNFSPTTGKVEVVPFSSFDVHPIYFLALQYLKNSRPDLLFNGADNYENSSDAAAFFRALVSGGVIDKVTAMYGNDAFYRHCTKSQDFGHLKIDYQDMPSYVRLHVPSKIKYGGGARVKSITMNDNWTKSDGSSYRQEYYYRTVENGRLISSGVAEYEPTVCNEETALRYPVYDKVTGLFFKEDEMYSEVPYGESYFPAANVGYSQVIVKTVTPENVKLSTSGIQRYEFYTAKDFPIVVAQTSLAKEVNPVPDILQLITAGFKQVSTSAYSQGYLIELNDMHGKQKAISTYPFIPENNVQNLITAVESAGYTSRIEYLYQSKIQDGIRKVDNRVDVLLADGTVGKRIVGQTYDFVVDQRENYSKNIGGGACAQFMLGNVYPPLVGVSAMPSFDCFEESVRSVATTKVLYNTGILKQTRAYNNGSLIVTENLQYDPYTGTPLLTTVTNEFDQPIYHYSMPAYWYYPNMGSSAENYRAMYFNNVDLPNGKFAFDKYDRFSDNFQTLTIKNINTGNNHATYWNISGNSNSMPISGKEIISSRFTNQLSATAATITSLQNPTDCNNRTILVLEQFNNSPDTCFMLENCEGIPQEKARVVYDSSHHKLYFFSNIAHDEKFCRYEFSQLLESCQTFLCFNVLIPNYTRLTDYRFEQNGNNVNITDRQTNHIKASFIWNDPQHYFPVCLNGVLQAFAEEISPDFEYDYDDAGFTVLSTGQENYLRIPNIYRILNTNLYVTERKQTGGNDDYATNTAYDGEFKSFSIFSHAAGNANNMQKPWTWTAEITKYSPFNFEIENVNALGIYSSALYGYKNSLVTAVANNARYDEIGFDSFENDPDILIGNKRGHIVCATSGSSVISTDFAHTGKHSLLTQNLKVYLDKEHSNLKLQAGNKYLFSCWVRRTECPTSGNLGDDYLVSYGNMAPIFIKEPKVECWQRIEVEFTYNGSNTFELQPLSGREFYVDDIRITPADATCKTYVYSSQNYRLLAELDENNFATFYNYDEEGVLVQVKKETERGIMTVKTTRQHIKTNLSQSQNP